MSGYGSGFRDETHRLYLTDISEEGGEAKGRRLAAEEAELEARDGHLELCRQYDQYAPLITEWESTFHRYINNEYPYSALFDFGFYNYGFDSYEAYYALHDVDGNDTMELLLKREGIWVRNWNVESWESIIAYIIVLNDGMPVNLFGLNKDYEYGYLYKYDYIEVPWSRHGAATVWGNGTIDCRDGDYRIYQIGPDGHSLIEFARTEPYDYPGEADLASASWRYYVYGNEVEDYDTYLKHLVAHGYYKDKYGYIGEPAAIDWKRVELYPGH